jgi:ATP-dependent helicase/nuclease subunit A
MSDGENHLPGDFTSQQREAITARGNLLVVAGAGTGKTRTLVARCLRLVAEERASLENILVVTFTEAAAAELRGRLRHELRELLAARPDDEHLAQQLSLLDAARISTLHSFCLQLAREHFHALNLDPQFIVLDEQQTRPLIRATLDELLERHYRGSDARARSVQALIRLVGHGSEARIRKLVWKLHAYSQSLPDPARWLDQQQRRFEQIEPTEWRQWFAATFMAWRAEWIESVSALTDAAPAVRLCFDVLKKIPATPSHTDAAAALRAVRSIDAAEEHWPRGIRTKARARLKEFFNDAEFLGSLLPDDRVDPLAQDWGWTRAHMAALVELTRDFTAAFSRAKRDLGGVDFADLEQCALRVLRDPAIAAAWRERLTHVFVDEYQDINDAQDTILTALSSGNRFMVGDVKQSIYRFRLANPKIFGGYAERWSKPGTDGRRIPLTENFRSRAALLDFINPLFASLMRAEVGGVAYEPLEFGAPGQRSALRARPGDPPRVELHFIARAGEESADGEAEEENEPRQPVPELLAIEREARLLARRLRELKDSGHEVWDETDKKFRPVCWNDMAVLLRSPAGRVEAFAKEFGKANVPLAAARDGFFESLEISDLINLLRLLDNPLQDVPLLAVLRSPLAGLSLDELAGIRADNRGKHFWTAMGQWYERRGARGRMGGGVQESEARTVEKVKTFLARYAEWRRLARQTSLSRCLDAVLAETHYEAFLMTAARGDERAANVRRLLDLTRQFDPYQRQGLFRFLRFVAEQQDEEIDLNTASPPAVDAVRLLSIHKSKGLEFPVVVVAGLGTRFNERDLSESILLDEHYGLCPRISPPDSDQSYPSLSYWLARRSGRMELRGEELRLLYVAMTRTRDTLVLIGTVNRKADEVRWEPSDDRNLSTAVVTAAHSHLDWLTTWLPRATADADWCGGRHGGNRVICWEVHDENDRVFADLAATASEKYSARDSSLAPDEIEPFEKLKVRLAWQYPFLNGTREAAKTSVSVLHRRLPEETDEEASPLFRFGPLSRLADHPGGLTGTEIGSAHHLFLQLAALEKMSSVADLRVEADRLRDGGLLTVEQTVALDLGAIAAFWRSDVGKRILAQRGSVHREIPFTARFSPTELASCGIILNVASEEFVVVQGIADLAVILQDEIQLVDFKTDEVKGTELAIRARRYETQLKLYALALSRIYRRPVTECRLHFLSARVGISVRLE